MQDIKETLISFFSGKRVLIALSGGVDSALLARCAQLSAARVVALTTTSELNPIGELEHAQRVAEDMELEHIIVQTDELSDPEFRKNPVNRCYYCKAGLSDACKEVARKYDLELIVEGTTISDLEGHRPGYKAIKEEGLRSPYVELKITKDQIRKLAKMMDLDVADRPSMACLASRFPYGQDITKEEIKRIGEAEWWLKTTFEIQVLRVRDHKGMARIEVGENEREIFFNAKVMDKVHERFRKLGFQYVTLDLQGYRTGALNEVLSSVQLLNHV